MSKFKLTAISIALCSNISYADLIRNNDDQIVIDTNTKLMWQDNNVTQVIGGDFKGLEEAIAICRNLDLGGYDDWMVPNINELTSIRNKQYKLKDIFQNTYQDDNYFHISQKEISSTGSDNGGLVYIGFGGEDDGVGGQTYFIRCVRVDE